MWRTFGPFAPLVSIITFTRAFTIVRSKGEEAFFGGITPLSGTKSLFYFFCAFLGGFMVTKERTYTSPYTKEITAETTRLSSGPDLVPIENPVLPTHAVCVEDLFCLKASKPLSPYKSLCAGGEMHALHAAGVCAVCCEKY
jgi:hypothetical protein